jgi:hypothetical protein
MCLLIPSSACAQAPFPFLRVMRYYYPRSLTSYGGLQPTSSSSQKRTIVRQVIAHVENTFHKVRTAGSWTKASSFLRVHFLYNLSPKLL